MANNTKPRFVVDLKTGSSYAINLNEDGKTEGTTKALVVLISLETQSQVIPTMQGSDAMMAPPSPDLPYGITSHAVEVSDDGKFNLFTIVWPEKEAAELGELPHVGVREVSEVELENIAPTPDTLKTAQEREQENEQDLDSSLKSIMDLIGLTNVKEDLKQSISLARLYRTRDEILGDEANLEAPSLHMVFTGNPGTGKTTIARDYAKVLKALGFIKKDKVLEVKREDLVGAVIGETEKKTSKAIEDAMGGILFIDEAYALANSGDDSKDFGKKAIDTLVAAMENYRDKLVVIVAGYPEPMKKFIESNPGLKSRFINYLEFKDYSLEELGEIMDFMLEKKNYKMTAEARETALGKIEEDMSNSKEHFGNGRTVRNLINLAEKSMAFRLDKKGVLKSDADLPEDEWKDLITTITVDDVKDLKLTGIDNKMSSDMGFKKEFEDVAKVANIANDDNKPSSETPALRIRTVSKTSMTK